MKIDYKIVIIDTTNNSIKYKYVRRRATALAIAKAYSLLGYETKVITDRIIAKF